MIKWKFINFSVTSQTRIRFVFVLLHANDSVSWKTMKRHLSAEIKTLY